MLRRLIGGFRRINRPPHPEDSVPLRVATTVATLIGVVALWTTDIVRPSTALIGLTVIPLGMVFSWRFRKRDNWEIKLVLTFAIVVAFGAFLRSIARIGIASVSDTIQPLGELMVWVQAMHSFDLPGRRDLYFSLAAALSMVAAGAVQALTNTFGLVIVVFGIASLFVLRLGHDSEIADKERFEGGTKLLPATPGSGKNEVGAEKSRSRSALVRSSVAFVSLVAAITAATLATYTLMPRFRTGRVVKLPFSIKGVSPVGSGGLRIETPGLEEATGEGGVTRVDGGYFGFANRMDLSVRGRPGDDLVMRVRADKPAFWRGLAYATYDGRFWHADEDPPNKIESFENEMLLPSPPGPSLPNSRYDELIQTFYIEAPQANLVFGAYRATRIYFPAAYVRVDRDGSVRSPVEVNEGLVYSVVSRRLNVNASELANAEYGTDLAKADLERYLQVPDSLPQRVRDLAYEITRGSATRYEKILAIERWLMQNTEYTLDIPPLPPGKDALDTFLFEDKKGFCEQIATAEVMLLRLAGVPARLVSGYVPGQHSFFSGMYEVRGRDAHTWTEIYFPGVGWVESDPTYVVPRADSFSQVKEALQWAKARYDSLPGWARAPFSVIFRFGKRVWSLDPSAVSTLVLLLLFSTAAAFCVRSRRRRRAEVVLAWEERMLKRLERVATEYGLERAGSETVREFVYRLEKARSARLSRATGLSDICSLADSLDRHVHSRHPLDDSDRVSLEAVINQLEAELKQILAQPSPRRISAGTS